MGARTSSRVFAALAGLALLACGCSGGTPASPGSASAIATTVPSTPVPSTLTPSTPAPSLPASPSAAPPAPVPSAGGVPADWAGQDVEVLPTDRRVVALTFDGGASDSAVDRILGTLAAQGVTATFFVTGQFARDHPDAVRAIARGGHPVGNHSDTHPSFRHSTNVVIRQQLDEAEAAITALTGQAAKPLFRFPFGDRTALDIAVVNEAGYIPFRWTVDTLGWAGTERGITAEVVCARVLGAARPGLIVLMHVGANPDDGTTFDADALPCIIQGLRARGYGFVTLREFVG